MLENEITVLRFSEVGGGRLLGTDPYARFWAKSGGWAFTRYWADTRYFTVVAFGSAFPLLFIFLFNFFFLKGCTFLFFD